MKHPEFTCSTCGSANLRRSHSTSLLDLPKMALGIYPFRCLDCRERFYINVWLFSKRKFAICPRCFRLEVIPGALQRMRLGLWRKLLVTAGARAHRCTFCGYKFLSFKRAESAKLQQPSRTETSGPSEAQQLVENS